MRKRSNFRTTGISCLLSVLVALSGALSPAQASASVPTDGEYVCMTGEPLAGSDTSLTYTINNGEVLSGGSCAGAVVIPEGVTSIGHGSFAEQSVLTSITIPASVTSIGDYAFFFAESLMDVNFSGDAPTNVGEGAFSGTASGARANISADAAGFGTDATWNGLVIVRALPMLANGQYVCTTGLLSTGNDTSPTYTITAGVVTSGGSCAGAVLIPEGVTSIGVDAFYGATGLASITIPASVTSIGAYAFSGATGLASITIPASVTSIGQEAFYGAMGLSSISIPASVTSIEIWAICETAVTSITVDSANPNYASQGGVLFNKNLTTLIAYPSGNTATSYVVPSSVTTIEDSSFFASLFLKSITIPNSVTSILPYAFANSPNLETVTIPASVTSIGEQAFAGASMLTSVFFLGNAPTTVNQNSFSSVAPSATAYIGQSATGFGTESTWYGLNVAVLYNVTYNSNGGTPVTSALFTQSGSIQTAPESTRPNYTLAGWSVTENGSVVTFPYTPTADSTLHAIWTSTATPPSPPAPLANLTKMAEEARARAVLAAQAEIRSTLISGKPLTVDQLLSADFKGVTSKNIGLVNADIAKLSEADKTDLKQIEKVVLKFATVDKIADGKFFYPSELIAVGLIPKDSKIKSSITSALKKLPGSSLDSFEKIQAAIASVEKLAADRKARLAAILEK